MSGWMNTCKEHRKQMIKDIEKKYGDVYLGYTDGDRRSRCDYPNCKNRTDYEIYWGDRIKSGSCVPL